MSVIIDDDKWPFGVLSVHTRERRVFTRDDINILQAVANVLATAVKHKRSQAALREAHLQLEARVRERTYDLQAANEELRAFAQTISRDLKLPLQNIRDYLNRLGLTVDDIQETLIADTTGPAGPRPEHMIRTLEHDIPETMGSLNQSVVQIERLVSAILRLSRLAHGELTYEPIDMAELVRTTLEMLALRLGHRGVAVSVGAVPSIVADRMAMEQILGHILANAVVYLDPDRPGRIRIEGETNHHEVIYRVQDNGRGIAPDVMRQIFELFCRGGEHDVPGEGTGLAYVKTLVRRHGGRIWCESELNRQSVAVPKLRQCVLFQPELYTSVIRHIIFFRSHRSYRSTQTT
jgi:signal transduction histidine kinase